MAFGARLAPTLHGVLGIHVKLALKVLMVLIQRNDHGYNADNGEDDGEDKDDIAKPEIDFG